MDWLAAAIFGWWILGGAVMVLRPQWLEYLTRRFWERELWGRGAKDWVDFWLSERGRLINRLFGIGSIVGGIIGLVLLYVLWR